MPLLPSGAVTRGRKLGIVDLGDQIRPINSGVLTRHGQALSSAARAVIDDLHAACASLAD